VSRDAWKGVEGTSKEDCYKKYVEKLLEVRLQPGRVSSINFLIADHRQLLEKGGDTAHVAEINAA
jgi:hypothetical protein